VNQKNLAVATMAIIVAIVVGAIVWHVAAPSHRVESASQPPPLGQAAVGATAPEFVLPSTGGLFDMQKARKPVFLEVFATWCPHCQRMTAVVDRLYGAYKSRVTFIGVSGSNQGMDGTTESSQADVLAWMQRFKVTYPIAYDPSLTVANSYLRGGFPTFAIVGRDGKITYLVSGELKYPDLAAALDTALR
jgi:thiol-disulfide isomerase/thioredoxin